MATSIQTDGYQLNILDNLAASRYDNSRVENLANNAIQNGIDKYMSKDYAGAAKDFRRAVNLAPRGENVLSAMEYMSMSFQHLGDYDAAVKAYEDAISLNPIFEPAHTKLGNLLYSLERFAEAELHYAEAVRLNKGPKTLYSLAQAKMQNGELQNAKSLFEEIINLSSREAEGYYGLGQVLTKMGRNKDAVDAFTRSIDLDAQFYDAWLELGMTYTDMDNAEKAEGVFVYLEDRAPSLADVLSRYMYKETPARFAFVSGDSTFLYSLPPKTPVAALDSYLATAGAGKTLTMVFMFTKRMDKASVENRFNWKISRSDLSGPGERYHHGNPVPDTEVQLSLFPRSVIYDESNIMATIRFNIKQLTDTATGTIDPSHIVFKFSGKDEFGYAVDMEGDEFSFAAGIR